MGLLRGCASSIIKTGGGGGSSTRVGGASTLRGDLLLDLPFFLFFLETRFVSRECLWRKYNLRNSADQPSHSLQKESKEHTCPRHASHFVCVSQHNSDNLVEYNIQVRQTILADFLGWSVAAILASAGKGSKNPKCVCIGPHPLQTAGKHAHDNHKVIRLLLG